MAEEDAVAVCVRVRPLNLRKEHGETIHACWKIDNNIIYQSDGSKSFKFDRVFHSEETTKNVYEEIAGPIISSAIQGYNGTIIAYGQTASGKTHMMLGSKDCLGVIPSAIKDIFKRLEICEREFLLRISYMEIYNETIIDLLCDDQKVKHLKIREDSNRNVYVADLTEEVVYSGEMALKFLATGEKKRHYRRTNMNQKSSRSHTIFRMILELRETGESSNTDGTIKVAHLNFVDLASSERAPQTTDGVQLKENSFISQNLFILRHVIEKLSDRQVGGFINYRDSKLTRVLQNSLGGNTKIRFICTITPGSFEETLTTLQFASTAKFMKNTPYVNEVSKDEALLKRYRRETVVIKKHSEEGTEYQEELRIIRDELKRQQKIAAQVKDHAQEKIEELSRVQEILAEMEEKLNDKDQKLQETQQQLLSTQEAMSKMRVKVTEAESLKNELERVETERLVLAQKIKSITKERNDLKELLEIEIKQRKEHSRQFEAAELQTKEVLNIVDANLKECDEIIKGLRRSNSEKEAQAATSQDTAQSDPELQAEHIETEEEPNLEEAYRCLKKQKNKMNALKMSLSQKEAEWSSMREQLQLTTAELERRVQELCEKQEQHNLKGTSEAQGRKDELEQVRALLLAKDIVLQNVESDRLRLSKQLEESQEEKKLLIKKLEELRSTKEALHIESEQQESIKELGTQVRELKASELQLHMLKEDAGETQKQLKGQGLTLSEIEMENLNLAHKTPQNLDEIKPLIEESDELKKKLLEDSLREDGDKVNVLPV